jgi:mono/diheme cytochrome c family protein
MHHTFVKVVPMSLLFAAIGANVASADSAAGGKLAQRWCASCHIVGDTTGPVLQGPPSFRDIAKSGMSTDQLRVFLSHPHGAMPNLSLTRTEIDDLIGYIQSLR